MPTSSPIRAGAIVLPAATLLGLISVLIRGQFIDPAASPAQFALAAMSSYPLGALLAVPSVILQSFSFIALYGFLRQSATDRSALWGMLFSLLGGAITLTLVGVFIFVFPAIGRLYQAGQTNVMQVAVAAIGVPFLPFALLSGVCSTIGAILFGAAFWRHQGFPKWAAALYMAAVPLFYFAPPIPYVPELIGFGLFFVANCFIVRPILSKEPRPASA